jgi:hypothetical protein
MSDSSQDRERRYFTVDEANALVPWLSECFGRIIQLRGQLRGLYSTLDSLGQRPDSKNLHSSEGSDEVLTARAKFRGLMELVQDELAAILNAGVEVKDLDSGLCDFWSLTAVPGREVYLCWKYGEKRIEFYHEPHAGFAGRKAIPVIPAA